MPCVSLVIEPHLFFWFSRTFFHFSLPRETQSEVEEAQCIVKNVISNHQGVTFKGSGGSGLISFHSYPQSSASDIFNACDVALKIAASTKALVSNDLGIGISFESNDGANGFDVSCKIQGLHKCYGVSILIASEALQEVCTYKSINLQCCVCQHSLLSRNQLSYLGIFHVVCGCLRLTQLFWSEILIL